MFIRGAWIENFLTGRTHQIPLFLEPAVVVESHILASAVCSVFHKSVSNLTKLPVVNTDSDPNRNVGRTDLSGKLCSVPASQETDQTPAVTGLRHGNPVTSAGRSMYECRTGNGIRTGSRISTGNGYTGRNL